MKSLWVMLFLIFSIGLFAHEGGHGDVTEGGKFGGIMAPIVKKEEAGSGNKSKFLFKAELVRSESGKISFYIFDDKMNLLKLDSFGAEITAKLEVKKKGKFTYFGEFKLTKNGNHFTGQLPKIEYKPFNIDFFLKQGNQELFVGFSNLD